MWTRFSKWLDRRRYRRRQNSIRSCHLYVVDDFGLALGVVSTAVVFPEDDNDLKSLSTHMSRAPDIGASVLAALDAAERAKKHAVPSDYAAVQAAFLDGMERYRTRIGLGKRRFESQMQLIAITRMDGEIHLRKHHKAHGRFAFEGSQLAGGQQILSAHATADEIGEAARAVLGA